MSEIKFRGLTKEGERVEGFLVGAGLHNDMKYILPFQKTDGAFPSPVLCDGEISIWGFIEVIPETVGQSTGLKDKNGKEIYAGDIIDNDWVVRFYDGAFVLCNPIDEPVNTCAKEECCKLSLKYSVITGTIHDHDKEKP